MNKHLLIALLFTVPFITKAQIGNVLNRAKAKVNQRVNTKIDKGIDEALDEVEGKGKTKPAANSTSDATAPSTKKNVGYASSFDFIPGEKLLYTEDFSQDAIGELPLNWNTNGKGEVVTVEGLSGKWMKMYQNSLYLTGNNALFTKNFTLEFDLILAYNYRSYTFPLVTFGMLASNDLTTTDNELLSNYHKYQSAEIMLRPANRGTSYGSVNTFIERKDYYKSTDQELQDFEVNYHKVIHVAVQVQESRLRTWINSEKVFDIPKALATQYIFNQLFFKIHNSGYKENEIGFYLSNLKVATGIPDTRHKLMEEGTFSTTGILFNVNEATLQPASYGMIREIAAVLKTNPSVRINITGHTDSDGADATNLSLSQKRADTVKDVLVNEFAIDAARMETDGKGESKPIADNKTKEGKAANRRVEFTKL